MNISFHLPGEFPDTTAQQKKIVRIGKGRPILVDGPKLEKARKLLIKRLLPHKPTAPLTGAIALNLTFVWPWRTTHPRRLRDQWVLMPKDTRPDADNMAKLLIDCMTKTGFWADDSMVTRLIIEKFHGETDGIFFKIEPGTGITATERYG